MKRLMLLALPLLIAVSPAEAKHHAAALKWMDGPPGLPSGSTFAVVSGDPGKAGNFVIRAKFPANYTIAPHHHDTDEHVTVLSGRVSLGMGDKLDKAKAKAFRTGAKVTAPAKMNHYAFTGSMPVTIQIAARGPFTITYVDPKDDPRGTK